MYAKLHSKIISSSIWSEDSDTCKVWITLMAMCDREGYVFGSVGGLARICALPVERVAAIMTKFASPDPQSSDLLTNPNNEGRRIEEVGGGWMLVNFEHYRELKDADEQRFLARERQRKKRLRDSHATSVTASDATLPAAVRHAPSRSVTPSEAEAEAESDAEQKKRTRERENPRFAPPTLEEVREYGKEIPGLRVEAFFDFYASKGWKVGASPMKDWRAAARRWRRTDEENGKVTPPAPSKRVRSAEALREAEIQREAERRSQKVEQDWKEYHRLLETDPEGAKAFREAFIKSEANQ